jgi:hypothetical protein
MTIRTKSQFYYIDNITENNFRINFDEGLGEVTAEVNLGNFAPSELPDKVAFAMNEVGTQSYSVSYDRTLRTFTISAPSAFDLLFLTGASAGTSIHPTIGFDNTDLTGLTSYTSQNASGTVYRPTLEFQDYVDALNFQEAVDASVNESASGVVETISFGQRKFYEFNITLVTDRDIKGSRFLENNTNAVSELRDFLLFATSKTNIEIMLDRDDPDTFEVILLEKLPGNSKGTGFKLRELYNRGLEGFYETGLMTWRVQNV